MKPLASEIVYNIQNLYMCIYDTLEILNNRPYFQPSTSNMTVSTH